MQFTGKIALTITTHLKKIVMMGAAKMKPLSLVSSIFSIMTGSLAIASFLFPYIFTISVPTMSIMGGVVEEVFLGWIFIIATVVAVGLAVISR